MIRRTTPIPLVTYRPDLPLFTATATLLRLRRRRRNRTWLGSYNLCERTCRLGQRRHFK